MGKDVVEFFDIKLRALSLAVPRGMTAAQREAINAVRSWASMKITIPLKFQFVNFRVDQCLGSCYLRDYVVYVPTLARRAREPVYTHIEPVGVCIDREHGGRSSHFVGDDCQKNPTIPDPDQKARDAPSIILKYAGVRSWSAFYRNASTWSIREDDGVYKMIGYRKHSKGSWLQDLEQQIQFPVGDNCR